MLLQLKKSLRFDDAAEAKQNKMLLNSVRNIITIIWQTKTLAFLKLKAGNKKNQAKYHLPRRINHKVLNSRRI